MSDRRGSLFVVSAPSGAGKTSLLVDVLERLQGVSFAISFTTRAPRPEESSGREYNFVSREEFQRLRQAGELLEWAEVHGELYGTPRESVRKQRQAGVDVVLEIDVQGAQQVRAAVDDAILVLILPPSWAALEQRLRARGTESAQQLERRLSIAHRELEHYRSYHYAIVNEDFKRASHELEAVILAERNRLDVRSGFIQRLLDERRG